MTGNKKKQKEVSIIRSSAAEYLTFITANGTSDVNAVFCDENVWLSQKMMGVLYGVESHTITYHLQKIFSDNELEENSVTRNFRVTASDGKSYDTKHYNLKAIISVGNKVVQVSPEYTSQRCSKCGTIDSSSRMKNHYHCSVCGHTEHADINAAKNIRDRYLLTLAGETGRFQPSERVVV